MTVAGAHVPGKLIVENPAAVVEKLKTFGSKIAVYAVPADSAAGACIDQQRSFTIGCYRRRRAG